MLDLQAEKMRCTEPVVLVGVSRGVSVPPSTLASAHCVLDPRLKIAPLQTLSLSSSLRNLALWFLHLPHISVGL